MTNENKLDPLDFVAEVSLDSITIILSSDMKKRVVCTAFMSNQSRVFEQTKKDKKRNMFLESLISTANTANGRANLMDGDIFDLHEGIRIALGKCILKIMSKLKIKGEGDRIVVNEYAMKGLAFSYLKNLFFSKKLFSCVDKQRKEYKKWKILEK